MKNLMKSFRIDLLSILIVPLVIGYLYGRQIELLYLFSLVIISEIPFLQETEYQNSRDKGILSAGFLYLQFCL